MPVYFFLIAIWILAVVPAVVGHRRAHRADALVSFAAFQARGRTLTATAGAGADPSRTAAARRQRVAGFFLLALAATGATAIVVQELWSTAVVAGMLHAAVAWYGAVVRSHRAR